MRKHCYFSSCEITPNGTFVLKVFTGRDSFFSFSDDFIFKLSSSEYDSLTDVLLKVDDWLNFIGLKFYSSEKSCFLRHIKFLFYPSSRCFYG